MKSVSKLRKKELMHLKNSSYLNASFIFTFTCAPFLVSADSHNCTYKVIPRGSGLKPRVFNGKLNWNFKRVRGMAQI